MSPYAVTRHVGDLPRPLARQPQPRTCRSSAPAQKLERPKNPGGFTPDHVFPVRRLKFAWVVAGWNL